MRMRLIDHLKRIGLALLPGAPSMKIINKPSPSASNCSGYLCSFANRCHGVTMPLLEAETMIAMLADA